MQQIWFLVGKMFCCVLSSNLGFSQNLMYLPPILHLRVCDKCVKNDFNLWKKYPPNSYQMYTVGLDIWWSLNLHHSVQIAYPIVAMLRSLTMQYVLCQPLF